MLVGLSINNYKGFRRLDRMPLRGFHVLVGPNGVGKTTFLDAIDFVRDCLQHDKGPAGAVDSRLVPQFSDLTYMREGGVISFDLWLDLSAVHARLENTLLLYQLAVKQDDNLGVCVADEQLYRHDTRNLKPGQLPHGKGERILGKTAAGKDFFRREVGDYKDSFNFGLLRPGLALTPPDEDLYFTALAVRRYLTQGVRYIQLDSRAMRQPCPATRPSELELDGTNLARAVGRQLSVNGNRGPVWPERDSKLDRWAQHLRYALPELASIGWARREADNAEYLLLRYADGLEAPSWLLSDGTLRMLALTAPAFLPTQPAIYLVEEPENGVHPKALEIILRSLSSVPDAQVLVATHSPHVVQQCGAEPLLCFARAADGVHIRTGLQHPALRDWDGQPDLGTVFAAGLLDFNADADAGRKPLPPRRSRRSA